MKKRIREQDIYYFDSGEQEDAGLCAGMLRQMIGEIMRRENRRGVLLFCIGTDRSTGDSLGPLIGHKLRDLGQKNERVQACGLRHSGKRRASAGTWSLQGATGSGRYLYHRNCGRLWKL